MILIENDLLQFAMTVDRILDCLRKHRKDVPAKDKEYIDNIIISKNLFKKKVLQCLLDTEIIFVDSKEPHLYKLDQAQLGKYGIGWHTFVREGKEPFSKLFSVFANMV